MFNRQKIMVTIFTVLLLLGGSVSTFAVDKTTSGLHSDPNRYQEPKPWRTVSFGIDLGKFFPMGDWTEHRLGAVDEFGGGFNIDFDLQFRPWRGGAIAINGGYRNISTDKWENYAAGKGDVVEASAYITNVGILLKPFLVARHPNLLKAELGVNAFFANGTEKFNGINNDMDYLLIQIGFIIGLEYALMLNEQFSLGIKSRFIFIPTGKKYADGMANFDITGFTGGLSLRFHL